MGIYDERYDNLYDDIGSAIAAIEERTRKNGAPIYYRGQNKDWAVTSSLHRLHAQQNGGTTIASEYEKTAWFINWYKSRKDLPQYDTYCGTDFPYYAIAQHYGYKTDLIDFTTSFPTAIGFSLLGGKVGDIGLIICLWEKDLDFIVSQVKKNIDRLEDVASQELLKKHSYNPFIAVPMVDINKL